MIERRDLHKVGARGYDQVGIQWSHVPLVFSVRILNERLESEAGEVPPLARTPRYRTSVREFRHQNRFNPAHDGSRAPATANG